VPAGELAGKTSKNSPPGALRVAFLVGGDRAAQRMAIEAVCQVPHVIPVGIFVDTYSPPFKARWRNLRRNLKREGAGYIFGRVGRFLLDGLETRANRIVTEEQITNLLRAAFPERCYSYKELGQRYGCEVFEVGSLNSSAAADRLRQSGADLGVVLGTRVLKRSTFQVPAMGCINLHKGRVPDYRGMPPAFWELFDDAASAGVTVHFVDDSLDTGDVVEASEIPIHALETVQSLQTKLDHEGARILALGVSRLQQGVAERRPQSGHGRTRTKPTRNEWKQLERRKPHLMETESLARRVFKTALYLGFYWLGIYSLTRWFRRRMLNRGAIILHHRVNDISDDRLTTNTRAFAGQLLALQRYYRVTTSSSIVERVGSRQALDPGTVAIHFDDCYRDVYQEAARLLNAAGMPAAMFIATGFVDTDRIFEHDRTKSPHRFENLREDEIGKLLQLGFEVGAHTVNHVDLGLIEPAEAMREVVDSKHQLERMSGRDITMFSFPFGKEINIRPQVREIVRGAGFAAMFAASGGFVQRDSDLFDIPRMGANSRYRPIDLLMELEGLSLAHWKNRLMRLFGRGLPDKERSARS
jgi:peptidoglycan/xylan/chitin deacetylase (PgdA/CDA1 family)